MVVGRNMGKLAGLRVLDLTQFLPGPMMTMMLADQGATVLKIEPPGGDPARALGPFEGDLSVWFRSLNRGKHSLVLDLKSSAGKARLEALLADADVLVEGFRPGVMARLGFAADEVRARHPRLIWCALTAFGQAGPLSDHPAHDLAVQALSGFLSVNDGPDGPVVPGMASADLAAGLTALSGVLMALLGRERTGRGDFLDIAMFDSLLPWCAHTAGSAIAGGPSPKSAEQRSLGGAAFYRVYRTADGRHVVLGGREPKFARTLLAALGREELIALAEGEAGPAQQPLVDFLDQTFATRTRDEWVQWFEGRDIAFAPVLDFREAFDSPHVAARGLLVEAGGGRQIAPAIRFADEPAVPDYGVPGLGEADRQDWKGETR